MTQRLARIVPADPDNPVSKGVKVITDEGVEVRGIKSITLTAGIDQLWTAHIEMNVLPPVELTAVYDITDITSTEREYQAREVTGEDAAAIGRQIGELFSSVVCLDSKANERLSELYRQRIAVHAAQVADNTRLLINQLEALRQQVLSGARNRRP